MLRQDINLYRHFETPQTSADLLTWKRYWILNLAVLILLIIILISSFIENIYTKRQEKNLQVQLASYQNEFGELKGTLPQLFFNKDASEAVKSMKDELAAQQQIIDILAKNNPFSEILTSFSRSIVPNLWLTTINILKNGNQITIKGNSHGNNVDEYLAKIDHDAYLKSFTVKLDELKNTDTKGDETKLNFEITLVKHEHE